MHVAICSDGVFPGTIGGIQRHTRLLVETMARIEPGLRITVLHTQAGARQFPGLGNVEEVPITPRPGRRQYMLECLRLSERFADALMAMPEAVIYSQGICVVRRIRQLAHRLIVNPHGLEAFQIIGLRDQIPAIPMRAIHRHMFRHAGTVVSLGGRLTEILVRECGGTADRVAVLPNGVIVPETRGRPARRADAPLRLMFVGRLAQNKGVPDLLAAIDELARRGAAARFELDVVGGGPLLVPLRSANSRPNVRFLDKVSDEALEALYASADALVLPTLFEGMPTVVLEAMARSLPVLVTDVGATKELVDSTNGEIIPKRDPRALAEALLRLDAMGAEARRALGNRGLDKVKARFTWEQVARAHIELFRKVDGRIRSSRAAGATCG
jgi:glycosyltransferase involved in cell wall biosynthesis